MPSISRFAYSLRCLTLAVAGLVVSTIAAAADYRVSSGDVLDITIFRVPDLSRQLTVDVTGQVAFPPIGEIKVDDATLDEIGIRIRAALQEQGILTDAQVTVGLVATRPVIVGGDVATPGAVPFHAGLTVRRAIAMAGGVGMSRTRGMEDIAELRSQRDVIALDLTRALARAARLSAELAGNSDATLTIPGPQLVSMSQRDEILAAEARRLKANLAESMAEKAHLDRMLEIIEGHIANLTRQSGQQKRIIDQQLEEIEQQRKLMENGLTSRNRVLEERRALESTQERVSDTSSEISRAYEEREAARYQIARFDERRQSALDADLAAARQEAETARARLSGVTERLAQLGMADATDVTVQVYRKGPEGDLAIPATEDTVLEPGDMVDITIDLSRLASEPLAIMSTQ